MKTEQCPFCLVKTTLTKEDINVDESHGIFFYRCPHCGIMVDMDYDGLMRLY